jgi:anti-sigma factor RsiW
MTHQEHQHCKDTLFQISDYLDGELDAGLCGELEEHLRDCHNCSEVLASLQKTLELCKSTYPIQLSGSAIERLKIGIREKCGGADESN